MSRLIEHFPTWETGGGILNALTDMPWSEEITDATVLDIDYFGNHSGLCESSALLEKMCASATVISSTNKARLVSIIQAKYAPSWQYAWDAMFAEYDPIENYNSTETRTPNISTKHQVSDDYEHSSKTSRNSEVTSENTGSDSTSKVYGFNSSTGVNSDSIHTTGTSTTSADAEDNYDETVETQEGYTEDKVTGTETKTVHGNIGVTTSQQMIESEIALRSKHNFFDEVVYHDLDELLTRGWWC